MFITGGLYTILEDPKKVLPYYEKAFELDNSDVETLQLKTNVHPTCNKRRRQYSTANKF